MPNRIIKESIHTSDKINRLTDFQFRLWVSLLTYVDDYGRGDARPAVIKGICFPLRERLTIKDILNALNALAGIGCIALYEVDGRPYLYFPSWSANQNIRNQKSKFPPPDDSCKQLQSIEINCNQLQSTASKCPRNPIQSNPNPNPNPESNPKENPTRARARGSLPSVEDVLRFAAENGIPHFPAESFVAFYEAKGWTINGEPIHNWQALAKTWAAREREKQTTTPARPNPALDYTQRPITEIDEEAWQRESEAMLLRLADEAEKGE